ncbi:uncharacterized protein [Gossypium hirsutum]|uniref:RNase H type-1 domain-containing protein n=1 Tax=Gossypium hirsutum TaxID=3635 RepID=A0ABM2YR67_GOSHI|nr:uncharacterized protein LOC107948041 [Gossypium hirsutum]
MGLQAAIERKIKSLEVYGDSALVIYQLQGEWEIRDSKLINYRRLVLGLVEEFDDITFNYLSRDENQMADALVTFTSMIKISRQEDVKPIQMSICKAPSYCYNIEEEVRDDHPWYQDILRYVRNREYSDQATENEKRALRRLACDYQGSRLKIEDLVSLKQLWSRSKTTNLISMYRQWNRFKLPALYT